MTTTLSLTAEFEDWLKAVRDTAHASEWEQVMHNIKALADDELAELQKERP